MKNSGTIKNKIRIITAGLFLVLILVFSAANLPLLRQAIDKSAEEDQDPNQIIQTIKDTYASDELVFKYAMIDLNGLFMRMSGRRSVNETTLLQNNMLTSKTSRYLKPSESYDLAGEYTLFSRQLREMGIDFVYVQAPYKVDLDGSVLPAGLTDFNNATADALLSALDANGVKTRDLRPEMSASAEEVGKYFYRTDHHWNADGGFRAYQLIMDEFHRMDPSIESRYADEQYWERHEKEDWFLGSRGKRTGVLYAGADPLIWYTPNFQTEMSCLIPHRNWVFKGDFSDAVIRNEYIAEKDYYEKNAYCVYIGGDYPIVKHLNPDAPNQKHILLIKDSYMLPVQSFLSTEFTEITVIDPRHYTTATLMEYCSWEKPDIALLMINAEWLDQQKEYADFGIEPDQTVPAYDNAETVLKKKTLTVKPKDHKYSNVVLMDELAPGKVYRFSFSTITVTKGKTPAITVCLYDKTNKKVVSNTLFDVEYSAKTGDTDWCFKVPKDAGQDHVYQLLVYAGIRGSAENIGIKLSGVKLDILSD